MFRSVKNKGEKMRLNPALPLGGVGPRGTIAVLLAMAIAIAIVNTAAPFAAGGDMNPKRVLFPEEFGGPTPDPRQFDVTRLESQIIGQLKDGQVKVIFKDQIGNTLYSQEFRSLSGREYILPNHWEWAKRVPEKIWSSTIDVPSPGNGIGPQLWPKSELIMAQRLAPKTGDSYFRWVISEGWAGKNVSGVELYLRKNGFAVSTRDVWAEIAKEGRVLHYLLKITRE